MTIGPEKDADSDGQKIGSSFGSNRADGASSNGSEFGDVVNLGSREAVNNLNSGEVGLRLHDISHETVAHGLDSTVREQRRRQLYTQCHYRASYTSAPGPRSQVEQDVVNVRAAMRVMDPYNW